MSKTRHRILIDISAEDVDEFLVSQRMQALGEVHTVSVKKMADEHVSVQRLAAGLGRKELEVKYAQLTELIRNMNNSELVSELNHLAIQLGTPRSSG